jgi:hypothetical protein
MQVNEDGSKTMSSDDQTRMLVSGCLLNKALAALITIGLSLL